MKIIAIIITYNGMKWYRKCFDSLKNSTIPIEIVAIDNSSSDDTVRYIQDNYPRVKLIANCDNLGFGKANNIGLEYAMRQNADYVFLLNQDAWVQPNTIEKLTVQMRQSGYGVLSPIHLSGDETRLDFGFERYIANGNCPGFPSDFLAHKNAEDRVYPIRFVNAAMWLLSKECLNKIGGFSPIFPHYGEDHNYTDRCRYHGQKVGIYPFAFGVHDRKPKDVKNMSVRQVRQANYVDNLVRLLDINRSFLASLVKFPFQTFAYNLKSQSFGRCLLLLLFAKIDVLMSIGNICKERRMTKKEEKTTESF